MAEIQSRLFTYAFEAITIAAASTRLTLSNVRNGGRPAEKVVIVCETAPFRWTDDGVTTPSATVGMQQFPGDVIEITNRNRIENFRAFRTGATSAVIQVSYLA